MTSEIGERPARTTVWDAPLRLFHWGLVLLIGLSWWSAETRRMECHRYSGYAVLALLVFRLVWGVAGGSTARFTSFVRWPSATIRYLRGREPTGPGHNPLGAWSVLAMLALLTAQVGLGLFAVDIDGIESGPLSDRISFDAGRWAAGWHHRGFNVLLALIGLHMVAIAAYVVIGRRNLLIPMITGRRAARPRDTPFRHGSRLALILGLLAAATVAWAAARGFHFER